MNFQKSPSPDRSFGAAANIFRLWILVAILSQNLSGAQETKKSAPASASAQKAEEKFLNGLWARGYYDLADDYLAELNQLQKIDSKRIDWLKARSKFEEAGVQVDLSKRRGLLEKSVTEMSRSISTMEASDESVNARLIQVKAVIELAHLLLVDSQDQPTPSQAEVLLKQSRERLSEARKYNSSLIDGLLKREKTFKLPVLPDDPRRPEFESTQLDRLNAQLQSALIDYEEAQTWPDKSDERQKKLTQANEILQKLYEQNRQQIAGQNARLWQAKCLQELGKLPEASGIYGELIDQADQALKSIKRRAMYFRLLAYRDRGDFALAADEANRWLSTYPDQARTDDGLGVQLELARNIILQFPKAATKEKTAGERVARERLSSVVRVYSRHQAEARKLLNQIRKSGPEINPSRLDLTAAMAAGQEALELKDWSRAEKCFEAASAKALTSKDIPNYVKARYFQTVALFRSEKYYEAYVLGNHIARRYPSIALSANSAEVACAAMTYAYNDMKSVDPASDLNRLTELAVFITKTWPDSPQSDSSRITMAEIARGQGRYDEAAKALNAIPPTSEQFGDAQAKLGLVLWRKSQSLNKESAKTEVDKNATDAIAAFRKSIEIRSKSGVPDEDLKVIGTRLDLADALIMIGNPAESITILNESESHLNQAPAELQSRLRRTKVRALIASDQLDQALNDLQKAEKSGQNADELSSLYFQLGQSIQDEMKELQAKSDGRLVRVRQSYQSFLKSLAGSKAGDSWQALQWVAEAQLENNQPAAALATFDQIHSKYIKQESFERDPANAQRITRTLIKTAEAARKSGQFQQANTTLMSLKAKNPNLLPLMMEQGRLLEDSGKSSEAFLHWRTLATRLGNLTPRPTEYYESWIEVAHSLEKQGKSATAKQTLAGILRLGGTKIPPEWKSAIESEIKRLSSSTTPKKTGVKS